jgi:hypothetical protein
LMTPLSSSVPDALEVVVEKLTGAE